jgi:ABC-type multidrug transport system fused ATPase/permease subunit
MSSAFWIFARRLLRRPLACAAALGLAFVSAGGLGAGLLGLGPILQLILGESSSLRSIVESKVADHPWIPISPGLMQLIPEGRLAGVAVVLGGLLALTIVGATANFLHQYMSLSLCTRLVADVRMQAFRHAIRLPVLSVVQRGPSEFTTRIIKDCAALQGGLSILTGRAVAQLTKGIAALAAAIWFDWRICVVCLMVGPVMAVVLRKLGKKIRRGIKGSLREQEVLLRVTTESLQGLRAVKTATAERVMLRRFNRSNDAVVRQELRVRTARALASPLIELLALVVVMGLAMLAASEIIAGKLTFDEFVLALGALAVASGSLKPVTAMVSDIQAAEAPAERLMELFLLDLEESARSRRLPDIARVRSSIAFDEVAFTYPGAEHPAVSGLSLEIRAGERVAIVGPNGCGKTTLLALLTRVAAPDSGRITLDGTDILSCNVRSLREQMGVVTQEPMVLRASIAENVTLGKAGITRDDVVAAATRALAHDFISRLPEGYDTVVSEQGASLSGGQRQRLAIARALLRNPSILILDEATSQVDGESEEQISRAVTSISRQCTVITVAHRLSTMLAADRIIVMDGGRVVDSGRHPELLARCSTYQRLVTGQSAGDRNYSAANGTVGHDAQQIPGDQGMVDAGAAGAVAGAGAVTGRGNEAAG